MQSAGGGQDALGVQLLEPDGTSRPYAHCPAQVADTDEGRSQNNQCGLEGPLHTWKCAGNYRRRLSLPQHLSSRAGNPSGRTLLKDIPEKGSTTVSH